MISVDLARRLRAAGVGWEPASGDRFVVPDTDLDQVFTIAEMVIEAEDVPGGRIVRFNGTTEWALDSIPASEVLWLPRESQLRASLGAAFARLERLPDAPGGWAVVLTDGSRHVDVDAEDAYARALASHWSG